MAVKFTTATEARVLSDAVRARANEYEAKASALLDRLLKPGDASPTLRFVLNNLSGSLLVINAAALASRVAALEQARGEVFRGTWEAAAQYNRGDLVMMDGRLFCATQSTRDAPGNGVQAWACRS